MSQKVLVSCCVLAIAACSTSGDDVRGTPDGGVSADAGTAAAPTIDDYIAADVRFGCFAYTCIFGIAPTEVLAFCGDESRIDADRKKSVQQGRSAFDAEKARACVSALRAFDPSSCWGPKPTDVDKYIDDTTVLCDGVIVPKVAVQGTCVRDDECIGGYCDGSATHCPGTCRARVGDGGECARTGECADGLKCASKKCVLPAISGGSCDSAKPCGAKLSCVNGSCMPPLSADAACDPAKDRCGADLYCKPSTSKCVARVAQGGKCDVGAWDLGPQSRACAGQMVCVGLLLDDNGDLLREGTCVPPFDAGGACEPTFGNPGADVSAQGCFLGLRCDDETKKCAAFPSAGASCIDDECSQSAWCNAGQCAPKKVDGDTCDKSVECVNGCLSSKKCGSTHVESLCHAP